MHRICFVCLGNICRSPTAEGVMRHLVAARGRIAEFALDSAGTSGWHVGEPPDKRATAAAARRGIHLDGGARRIVGADLTRFDLVLAMDLDNLHAIQALAAQHPGTAKIALFRSFDPTAPPDAEVPDPYYGGPQGFDEVIDICMRAATGLLDHFSTPSPERP